MSGEKRNYRSDITGTGVRLESELRFETERMFHVKAVPEVSSSF